MRIISIIICFSYPGNEKYIFDPNYVRSDLRRILSFSKNVMGCPLDNTYVLTDISGSYKIKEEILYDFYDEVKDLIRELGYTRKLPTLHNTINPLHWLQHICQQVCHDLNISADRLFQKIARKIIPIIRTSTVVEFARLFTNFILLSGRDHFDQALRDIFTLFNPEDRFLFYYTGHGVRFLNVMDRVEVIKDICLVIPTLDGHAEMYSRNNLQSLFQMVPPEVSSVVVFDCCHAEAILNLPHQAYISKRSDHTYTSPLWSDLCLDYDMIYLASTRTDQTCGFYKRSGECGSVFTYYLIKYWSEISSHPSRRKINRICRKIEHKVLAYRSDAGKPPQNMLVGLSSPDIKAFPKWLFQHSSRQIFELVEALGNLEIK